MGIRLRRTVIALLFLSLTLMGCAGQGKANGGGTIIGNPGLPAGPLAPKQKSPVEDRQEEREKRPAQEDEEQTDPRTHLHPNLGGALRSLVFKPSKWILVPPGLPPSHGGLTRSPVKIYVVLDDEAWLGFHAP